MADVSIVEDNIFILEGVSFLTRNDIFFLQPHISNIRVLYVMLLSRRVIDLKHFVLLMPFKLVTLLPLRLQKVAP